MALFKPVLSRDVMNLVFSPAAGAYFIVVVNHEWFGLAFYSAFLLMALRAELFRRLRDWPTISKMALITGPLLVASAFVVNVDVVRYWAILPGVVYTLLAVSGGVALRQSRLSASGGDS